MPSLHNTNQKESKSHGQIEWEGAMDKLEGRSPGTMGRKTIYSLFLKNKKLKKLLFSNLYFRLTGKEKLKLNDMANYDWCVLKEC